MTILEGKFKKKFQCHFERTIFRIKEEEKIVNITQILCFIFQFKNSETKLWGQMPI
jgi:hypothetical protein